MHILFALLFAHAYADVTKQVIVDHARATAAVTACDSAGSLFKCAKNLDQMNCAGMVSDAFSTCMEKAGGLFKPSYKDSKEGDNLAMAVMSCAIQTFRKNAEAQGKWQKTKECSPPATSK